jgi:hypothetical protein
MLDFCPPPYGNGFRIGPSSGVRTGAPPLGGGHVGKVGRPGWPANGSICGVSFINLPSGVDSVVPIIVGSTRRKSAQCNPAIPTIT